MRRGWRVLEPGQDFVDGRHIRLICAELERVSRGETDTLLINVPPGYMKSLLVTVFWPAWEWTSKPARRFLCGAYADDLAVRDSLRCRQLIESEWYQGHWGGIVQPSPVQWSKDNWQTAALGSRVSVSVGGKGTGLGGNHLVLDDPHNATEIHSATRRKAVVKWWQQVWTTRQRPPGSGGRVVIMQRLHTGDLSGYLIEQLAKTGRLRHICLPAEYEPDHPNRCELDWRTNAGELLWPEMFNERLLRSLKADLGTEFARAGQLQQRPVPAGGGILKERWWNVWDRPTVPKCDIKVMSVDTAYTARESNDYSAVTVWGRFYDEHERSCLILLWAWRDRLEFPELVGKLEEFAKRHKPTRVLVENKAAGHSVMQELRRRVEFPSTGWDPRRYGDKTARGYAVQSIFEGGMVWAPPYRWASVAIEECAVFPNGDHDDLVDTVTMSLLHLRDAGVALRPDEPDTNLIRRRTPSHVDGPIYGRLQSRGA